MFNKSGGKVRLTFKLEQDQLWIGTKGEISAGLISFPLIYCQSNVPIVQPSFVLTVFSSTERTEKVPMGSIKNVVSEPIEGHEDYHMMVRTPANICTSDVVCVTGSSIYKCDKCVESK